MTPYQIVLIGDPEAPSFSFEGDAIMDIRPETSVDLIGESLATDVMDIEVNYNDTNGTLRTLAWATPVYYYRSGALEGKFYSTEVSRIGRERYRIRTASAAGILEYEKFYGGLYAGQNFRLVAEQIIGSNGLQPYSGIYRKFSSIKVDGNTPTPVYMGNYQDKALTTPVGAYWTATMGSKLKFKIKINGFHGNDNLPSGVGKSYVLPLVGAPRVDNSLAAFRNRYGLFMRVDRANTSDPFPEFGTVIFVYNTSLWVLGTPISAEEAVYEIELDPHYMPDRGRFMCNGEINYFYGLEDWYDDPAALHCIGGGVSLYEIDGTVVGLAQPHWTDIETSQYTVWDASGTILADYAAVRDTRSGLLSYYDLINKREQPIIQLAVNAADLTDYDAAIYGDNPWFNNHTSFQTDVLRGLSYAEGIGELPVYGWLPISTKREALHQLLFSTGIIIVKGTDGGILFTSPITQQAGEIAGNSVYDTGGEVNIEHTNRVLLTEHAFNHIYDGDPETLYKNPAPSVIGTYIAEFEQTPVCSVTDFDLNLYCFNCNAAIVSGSGTIHGRLYQHIEAVLEQQIANYPDGRDISYPNATLVTLQNSSAVLERLAAYYSTARKENVSTNAPSLRCGCLYSLTNAFGEAITGFLVKATGLVSAVIKSACVFICGYTPPQVGSIYSHFVVLTGTGTWEVPASVFNQESPKIRVVLIGGGTGGASGFAGAAGQTPDASSGSSAAEGGAVGAPGAGGKIIDVTISNPAAFYDYSCGTGGAGGSISSAHNTSNAGQPGGATTLIGGGNTYSSASGAEKESGIVNFFTGWRYAQKPVALTKSKVFPGGKGGWVTVDSGIGAQQVGENVQVYDPTQLYFAGRNGRNQSIDGGIRITGGLGGGAGFGSDGGDGTDEQWENDTFYGGIGGNGGAASRTPLKATEYQPGAFGFGGLGGGGGGGGGSGGWAWDGDQYTTAVQGTGGAGGFGGAGGDGSDGCVLIYY